MSAVYEIRPSDKMRTIEHHLPPQMVYRAGETQQHLYTWIHTKYNRDNYLLTPSPTGEDMQVAHLQPPSPSEIWRASSPQSIGASSAAGHGTEPARQPVACEALYNLKWLIENTGVRNPVYKLSLQSAEDQPPTPLFQISKPNQHAKHWTMFYFAYAGYDISPRRIQFGRIEKNQPSKLSRDGRGTRVVITGKTEEERSVWQTLGQKHEFMVEWVVICAALQLLDDEIIRNVSDPNTFEEPLNAGPAGFSAPRDMRPMGSQAMNGGSPNRLPNAPPLPMPPTNGPRPFENTHQGPPQQPLQFQPHQQQGRPMPPSGGPQQYHAPQQQSSPQQPRPMPSVPNAPVYNRPPGAMPNPQSRPPQQNYPPQQAPAQQYQNPQAPPRMMQPPPPPMPQQRPPPQMPAPVNQHPGYAQPQAMPPQGYPRDMPRQAMPPQQMPPPHQHQPQQPRQPAAGNYPPPNPYGRQPQLPPPPMQPGSYNGYGPNSGPMPMPPRQQAPGYAGGPAPPVDRGRLPPMPQHA